MKHTEIQIKEIAKRVMKDIDWPYDEKKGIRPAYESKEEIIERLKNLKIFEEIKPKIISYWSVGLDFPEDDGWGERNKMFIEIADETGVPYEISHKQYRGKLKQDTNGKYYIEDF